MKALFFRILQKVNESCGKDFRNKGNVMVKEICAVSVNEQVELKLG